MPHVPYRGAGPGLTDLLAGQIPALVPAMTNIVLEHHRAGKLRILAVTHHKRLAAAPEIPTAVEQGFHRHRRAELHRRFRAGRRGERGGRYGVGGQPEAAAPKSRIRSLLISGTFELEPLLSAADYKKYVESEITRWRPIVTAMGIKID